VEGPAFGEFLIEVDGVQQQTINSQAGEYRVGAEVIIEGLATGEHDLRIIPVSGTSAIDVFIPGA
jgi:hypothetical protein